MVSLLAVIAQPVDWRAVRRALIVGHRGGLPAEPGKMPRFARFPSPPGWLPS